MSESGKLEITDTQTKTWSLVRRKCGDIVRRSTDRVLSTGLDPVRTEFERGRISAAREILGLDPMAAARPPQPE